MEGFRETLEKIAFQKIFGSALRLLPRRFCFGLRLKKC